MGLIIQPLFCWVLSFYWLYKKRNSMDLNGQRPKLRVFGFRSLLLKVHYDLFLIHNQINLHAAYASSSLTNLELLVLALEDRRFMRHRGVDFRSILREIFKAMSFKRHGGASTIDMQFVRTCTGYREIRLSRKFYEILLSYFIQFRYSKIVILRSYLACAYFGTGLCGADQVAKKIFKVTASELSLEQASYVAAMLVYPMGRTTTDKWWLKLEQRARYGMRVYISNKKRLEQLPI